MNCYYYQLPEQSSAAKITLRVQPHCPVYIASAADRLAPLMMMMIMMMMISSCGSSSSSSSSSMIVIMTMIVIVIVIIVIIVIIIITIIVIISIIISSSSGIICCIIIIIIIVIIIIITWTGQKTTWLPRAATAIGAGRGHAFSPMGAHVVPRRVPPGRTRHSALRIASRNNYMS